MGKGPRDGQREEREQRKGNKKLRCVIIYIYQFPRLNGNIMYCKHIPIHLLSKEQSSLLLCYGICQVGNEFMLKLFLLKQGRIRKKHQSQILKGENQGLLLEEGMLKAKTQWASRLQPGREVLCLGEVALFSFLSRHKIEHIYAIQHDVYLYIHYEMVRSIEHIHHFLQILW